MYFDLIDPLVSLNPARGGMFIDRADPGIILFVFQRRGSTACLYTPEIQTLVRFG